LKARAEVIEGWLNDLLWDLTLYRHALQRVIDALWDLDKLPRKSQMHQLFYPMLRVYGFRAHVARNIYDQALAVVKSARANNGSKPIIKRMSARLDYQDARVDLSNGMVKVIIRDKWYTLRLRHRGEYVKRFTGLRWREVHVNYVNNKVFVSIIFEARYKPYEARGFLAIDVNLRQVTTFNGVEVKRFGTRLTEALSRRAHAEHIQRRYGRRWRYNKKILNRIRSLHRRARNIIIDDSWKMGKRIVAYAMRHGQAVVLEDLNGLKSSINGKSSAIVWKLSLFAYGRLQRAIISKAIEHNVPIILINPRNTSSTCPRCGGRLEYVHRLAHCPKCGLTADRDVIGAMNIWIRAVQGHVGLPGSSPKALPMKNETTTEGGKQKDEGMRKELKTPKSD
jgi:putative transposase